MTVPEDDGDQAAEPRAPWGDDVELPERVIVVPSPSPAGALHPDVEDDSWEGPPTEAVALHADRAPDERLDGPPTEAIARLDVDEWDEPTTDRVGEPAPELDVPDDPWREPPTDTFVPAAAEPVPELDVDDPWREAPTDTIAPATAEPAADPFRSSPAPTPVVDEPWDGGAAAAAAFRASSEPEPSPMGRDETGPGALRPSAPEPVSVKRGPSRSRRAVSRLRAFIGLLLIVVLSGVGLAAAIGVAVLLVAFVLKRAFGS